jgi:hypothetical protein
MRQRRAFFAGWPLRLCLLMGGFLAGCAQQPAPVPTVVVSVTTAATETLVPVAITLTAPQRTATTRPTLEATLTPRPTLPPAPATATFDPQAAGTPVAMRNTTRGTDVTLTTAQINAELARLFDAAPVAGFAQAPRVTLSLGLLTLRIRLADVEEEILLLCQLNIPNGLLEAYPVSLQPQGAKAYRPLVKQAEELLNNALDGLARRALAAGESYVFYGAANIQAESVVLNVIRPGE